ncbi:MAG: hypothetical protein PSX37_13310, partial [bacterium]|nr:hypothetical protein [bacterium]
LLLASCVTERKGNQPQAGPQPQTVVVGKVWIAATPPQDTDVNGYFDTVDLTIYLFGHNYPASLIIPGEFKFDLVSKSAPNDKPFATWSVSKEAAAASTGSSAVGPFYSIRLSLLDRGGDNFPDQTADIVAVFTPTAGAPVREVVTVRIGKLRS